MRSKLMKGYTENVKRECLKNPLNNSRYLSLLDDEEIVSIARLSTSMNYPSDWQNSMFYEILGYEYKKVDGNIKKVDYKNKNFIRLKIVKIDEEAFEPRKIGYITISDFDLNFTNLLLSRPFKMNRGLIAKDFPVISFDSNKNIRFDISKEEWRQQEVSQNAYINEMSKKFGKTYCDEYEKFSAKFKALMENNGIKTK